MSDKLDVALWINPMFLIRMEPVHVLPMSMTVGNNVFAYGMSSKLKQALPEHSDQGLKDMLQEILLMTLPIEAELLENYGNTPSDQLTGAIFHLQMELALGDNGTVASVVIGLSYDDPTMTHYFAVMCKEEAPAYIAERNMNDYSYSV